MMQVADNSSIIYFEKSRLFLSWPQSTMKLKTKDKVLQKEQSYVASFLIHKSKKALSLLAINTIESRLN